jgi:hypothetical protein
MSSLRPAPNNRDMFFLAMDVKKTSPRPHSQRSSVFSSSVGRVDPFHGTGWRSCTMSSSNGSDCPLTGRRLMDGFTWWWVDRNTPIRRDPRCWELGVIHHSLCLPFRPSKLRTGVENPRRDYQGRRSKGEDWKCGVQSISPDGSRLADGQDPFPVLNSRREVDSMMFPASSPQLPPRPFQIGRVVVRDRAPEWMPQGQAAEGKRKLWAALGRAER